MVSKELSLALRRAFPTLTVDRVEHLWRWVVAMEQGRVYLVEPEIPDPTEVIVCLHLARELDYRNREIANRVIRRLSGEKKRRLYPNSYSSENAAGVQSPKRGLCSK